MESRCSKIWFDGNRMMIQGSIKAKVVELSPAVAECLRSSARLASLIEELCNDPKFGRRLTSAGAFASLASFLCAIMRDEPLYKAARRLGISHERLYRIKRGLEADKLYQRVTVFVDLLSGPQNGR